VGFATTKRGSTSLKRGPTGLNPCGAGYLTGANFGWGAANFLATSSYWRSRPERFGSRGRTPVRSTRNSMPSPLGQTAHGAPAPRGNPSRRSTPMASWIKIPSSGSRSGEPRTRWAAKGRRVLAAWSSPSGARVQMRTGVPAGAQSTHSAAQSSTATVIGTASARHRSTRHSP
jgi:hypothetical protein